MIDKVGNMVTLEEINQLRQQEKWQDIIDKSREHLHHSPNESFILRALVQAFEKVDQRGEEYEIALYKLLEMKDRVVETAQKLAKLAHEQNEKEEAVRHLEIAIEAAVQERQYEALEESWMRMSELEPENIEFFLQVAENMNAIKQHQRASMLLQMLLPAAEARGDWQGRLKLLKRILEYTPKEASLRDLFIDTYQKLHPDSDYIDRVLDYTDIKKDRSLPEAVHDVEIYANFLPDSYVRHPDWGIGRVKDLNLSNKRVTINFQRKRDHSMDVELAKKAVEALEKDDFRVQKVIDRDGLIAKLREQPVDFIKQMLRSFGGSLNAKEIKDHLVPDLLNIREWTTWWSNTSTAIKKDQYVAVSGGATKKYTLRDQAASDEEELLQRFDDTKSPHTKVDQIYAYLRTTKKSEIHEHVIKHFSKKIHAVAHRRKSLSERVELWFTNEDLKEYVPDIESLPIEILAETIGKESQILKIMQHLRFKNHQLKYAQFIKEQLPDRWQDLYQSLLIEPDIMIRDELAKALMEIEQQSRVYDVVDQTVANFRQYPSPFIWIAHRVLVNNESWLDGKLTKPVIIERLLLLVDYLTSQAKRRDKDEAANLRKIAGDAREIIRRNQYSLFKEFIKEADESTAQSIYRRAQTNEGLDTRTAADLTSFVRARFPDLFMVSTEESSSLPEGLLALRKTYESKQNLLRRLIEKDLPEVVKEIETARQHGDLKENAEYHAARDKQKLLSSQVAELKDALHVAQPIDLETVTADQIGFGTIFKIKPIGSDIEERYIMLGPWESNPDIHILSYQAPFARAFMGKQVGDMVEIELPSHTGRYEVISIEPLTFEVYRQATGNPSDAMTEAEARIEDEVNVSG